MARYWYYVAPLTNDKWNILFDDQPRPYIYPSEDAALKAALKAAEKNYKKNGTPSGVRIKEDGRWREEQIYGE